MRILVLSLLVSLGAVTVSAAQDAPGVGTTAPAAQTTSSEGLLREPQALQKGVDFAGHWVGDSAAQPKDGFYPDLDIVPGAGWISVGPGYRTHLFNGRALVDASAVISWRAYKEAQARFEGTDLAAKHLTLGVQGRWQDYTQVNYFGLGPDSLESLRSEYRLKDTDVLGYGVARANDWLSVTGRFGWLKKPTLDSPSGPFDRGFPDALQVFPGDPGVSDPSSFLHGDVAVVADSRDYRDHPTKGGLYRASLGVYSDRDGGQFSFRRYEAEGAQAVPIAGERWVVTLHGWGVFSDTSDGKEVPFYLLPTLGGNNTLRGFDTFRFHDRNLLMVSAESRWALYRQVDAAIFVDAGNVASRAGDLDLKKTSYGVGLRAHSRTSTIGRLDIGHSTEGWQFLFTMSDPLRLARRSERNTVVPFVP